MLSGNGVKTVRCSYDPLCDPLRLKMLSGNGAQLCDKTGFVEYPCALHYKIQVLNVNYNLVPPNPGVPKSRSTERAALDSFNVNAFISKQSYYLKTNFYFLNVYYRY